MTSINKLRILSQQANIDLTVHMGDGPATITGGLGGWKEVERLDQTSITTWEGRGAVTQDVPVLLNGFEWWSHKEGRMIPTSSVQPLLQEILKLGLEPFVFSIEGAIHFPKKHWVLPDGGIERGTDDTIREEDGMLVRQSLVLHLMEYVNPKKAIVRNPKIGLGEAEEVTPANQRGEPGKTGGTAFPGKTYTVGQGKNGNGETLVEVAALLYGRWEAWKALGAKNNVRDANRKLKPGTNLVLP
jgi:hypothetical protein